MKTFVIGSKQLSVDLLRTLTKHGCEVLGVITRDHEPGMQTWHEELGHESLAAVATDMGIPVHQGLSVNSEACRELLRELQPEVIFSCFWGEIFRKETLDIPPRGIFNFHTAYLPKNRGSRPIPWAMINGESYTGMTIHQMAPGVDNGPILDQVKVPIMDTDTAGTLYVKVCTAGITLFDRVLPEFIAGKYKLRVQDELAATYQPRGEPYGGQIQPGWNEAQIKRFQSAFTFPPFRAWRSLPSWIKTNEPSVLWYTVIAPVIALPEHPLGWKQDNIGNKAERQQLRNALSNVDLPVIQGPIDGMYPVHDMIRNMDLSAIATIEPFDPSSVMNLHPRRLKNGVFHTPLASSKDLKERPNLLAAAKDWAAENQQDAFIGIHFENPDDERHLSQELQKSGVQVLSFSQVYDHFDTSYEYIST